MSEKEKQEFPAEEIHAEPAAEAAEETAAAEEIFTVTREQMEKLEQLAQSILYAGSYGTLENRSRQRLEKLQGKYKNPVIRGIVYWAIQFCRPLEEMRRSYPVLKKLPVLLPVFLREWFLSDLK